MDEGHIRDLLEKMISSILDSPPDPSEFDDVRQRVAEATWDALILLLRETILQNDTIFIEGLGLFEAGESSWTFQPATTLVELEALKLAPDEGAQLTARRALNLLSEGIAMLELVREDLEVDDLSSGIVATPDDRLLRRIFPTAEEGLKSLSTQLTTLKMALHKQQERLQPEKELAGSSGSTFLEPDTGLIAPDFEIDFASEPTKQPPEPEAEDES